MSGSLPKGRGTSALPVAVLSPELISDEWITCGRFGRPHGVKGEVRLWGYNQHTELLEVGMNFYVGQHPKLPSSKVKVATHQLTLSRLRSDHKGLILGFEEIRSRDTAQVLNHLAWLMPRTDFPILDEQEFYLVDLIGADGWAISPEVSEAELKEPELIEKTYVGKLTGLLEAGAGDLFIFESKEFGEITIPNQDPFVISIDLDSKHILIRAIPGLLEGGL